MINAIELYEKIIHGLIHSISISDNKNKALFEEILKNDILNNTTKDTNLLIEIRLINDLVNNCNENSFDSLLTETIKIRKKFVNIKKVNESINNILTKIKKANMHKLFESFNSVKKDIYEKVYILLNNELNESKILYNPSFIINTKQELIEQILLNRKLEEAHKNDTEYTINKYNSLSKLDAKIVYNLLNKKINSYDLNEQQTIVLEKYITSINEQTFLNDVEPFIKDIILEINNKIKDLENNDVIKIKYNIILQLLSNFKKIENKKILSALLQYYDISDSDEDNSEEEIENTEDSTEVEDIIDNIETTTDEE